MAVTEITPPCIFELNEKLGRVLRPNVTIFKISEGFGLTQTNKYHYLGPAYPEQKSPNTIRIALIGDSFVEGLQVFERHHFRTLMEKRLGEQLTSLNVEVLNFGRDSFDIYDMYVYQKYFVEKFNPDMTIYLVSAGDFRRSNHSLRPNLIISDDEVEISDAYKKKTTYRVFKSINAFLQRYRIAYMALETMRLVKEGQVWNTMFDKFYTMFNPQEENTTSITPGNYTDTNKILSHIEKESQVYFVHKFTNNPAFDFKNEHVTFIKKYDINYIETKDALLKSFSENHSPTYWPVSGTYGHYNHEAHQVIANVIADSLLREIKLLFVLGEG